ncbi:hypothetical protein CCACVL1_28010 [Corchorus capsularis]|uniref:CBM10 domain-containing protein n=1 Tax=Corchorus capsularis TaxID=210143 RepID=A0A1R3G7U0_COCAP|nr:hypothetical protein CCACVL1_28010 [Corchorus capsularis]
MEGFCFKEPHRLRELLLKTLEKPIVSRNAPRKNIHQSIPKIFTSDLQKRESYGNDCYKYCIKNAMAYTTDDDDYGW